MTGAEHIAQRELVAASLLADEQREHHHDVYSRAAGPRRLAGIAAMARGQARRRKERPRATPPRARRGPGSGHECPACRGTGEIGFNPGYPAPARGQHALRGLPRDRCRACAVTGAGDAVTPATTRGKRPAPPRSARPAARELLLWLHHLPSREHPIVGCHRHRPA